MQISKPLLAGKFDPAKAKFPYAATPKIDGIRFLMVNGQAVSRSFKPIRNKYIQDLLSTALPDGVDGELTAGNNFQDSTSNIMRIDGEPNFKCWIFDYVDPDGPMLGYRSRMEQLKSFEPFDLPNYEVLYPEIVFTQEEADQLMTSYIEQAYEGLMLRDPNGIYKFGRSTVNENILLKVKNFIDDEAVVVGFKEKMHNDNPATKDAFGRTERSTAKAGLKPTGLLGGFLLRTSDGKEFTCGSGLNDELRQEIWKNRDSYLNRLVKYKYMEFGIKEDTGIPRHPVFIGFRSEDDL